MKKLSRGIAIPIGALVLILVGGWFAKFPENATTPLAPSQRSQNAAQGQRSEQAAMLDQGVRAPQEARVPATPATPETPASTPSKSLGDRLVMGVDALQPAMALETARLLARCATLQQDLQFLEERIGREAAGAYKEKMLREKEALLAQERNCQTLPASVRTQGDELQLRGSLLRQAYSARVPGAAAELLGIPQQFAGVPANQLKERAAEDARAGDLPTLTAWALLTAQTGDLESPAFKVFAFALQRASSNPELQSEVSLTQAVYARVLEQYWAKRYPEQTQAYPLGFNMDSKGALLYPKGFEEPRDSAYLAQARAMDEALARAVHRSRKPS